MPLSAATLQVSFQADPGPVVRAIDSVNQKVNDTAARSQAAGAALLGMAGAATAGFVGAVKTAASFDAQLSAIASVGGADAQARMQEISDVALKLGADTSFSASEAAAGMEEMIKAGLSVEDVLGGAAQAALDLSAASGTGVEESAVIMSSMLNVFGDTMTQFQTEAEKSTYIADLLAQAANASATDVHGLGLALQASAAIARGFGLDAEETTTALAMLAQSGMKSSDMGTSLKSMLLSVTRQTKPAKEALGDLGLTFDDLKDSTGQFIGIEEMFAMFRQGAKEAGISGLDLNVILNKLFGSDGGRAAQIFFRTTDQGWADMRAGMANAGTAGEQASTRLDNLQGDIEALRGSVETVAIRFGRLATGPLRAVVKALTAATNWFGSLSEPVQQIIAVVGGLATVLAAAAGAWALFGNQIMLALSGLRLLAPPILLVTAVLGGLYLAYRSNFLGFADGVNAAAAKIAEVFGHISEAIGGVAETFASLTGKGFNPLEAALRSLNGLVRRVFGADNPISRFVSGALKDIIELGRGLGDTLLPVLRNAGRYFRIVAESGDFLNARLAHLPEVIQPFVRWLGVLLSGVRQVAEGFREGGLLGALRAFADFLPTLADEAGRYLGSLVNLGKRIVVAVWDGLRDRWPAIQTWFLETALPAIGNAVGTAIDTLKTAGWNLITAIGQGIQERWPAISAWVTETGLPMIGDALAGAWDWLKTDGVELIGQVAAGAEEAWNTFIPWLRDTALPQIGTTLTGIGGALLMAGSAALGKIREGIEATFPTILDFLSTEGLPEIVATIVDKAAEFIGAGMSIIGSILKGIYDNRQSIWDFFSQTLLPGILKAMAAGPVLLIATGIGIVRGLLKGFRRVWDDQLGPWVSELGDLIVRTIGDASEWLLGKGQEISDGLQQGIQGFYDDHIAPWLSGLKGRIVTAITEGPGAAIEWLKGVGTEIMGGLQTGAEEVWTGITTWLGGRKDAVLTAISEAGSINAWLTQTGRDILTGLLTGVTTFWDEKVAPWFGLIKDRLTSFFGEDPSAWLTTAGTAILTGLHTAITTFWTGTVSPWFTGMPARLVAFFVDAATWLAGETGPGSTIIGGLLGSIQTAWTTLIVPFFTGLPAKLLGFFVDAATWLGGEAGPGPSLLGGLLGGIQTAWTNLIVPFFEGVPAKIIGFFANAGEWLLNAGAEIIQGLIDGIGSKFEALGTTLRGVETFIKENKGPIDHDRTILYPAGVAIMEGLSGGIEDGIDSSLAPALGSVMGELNAFEQKFIAWVDAGLASHPELTGALARQLSEQFDLALGEGTTIVNEFGQALNEASWQFTGGDEVFQLSDRQERIDSWRSFGTDSGQAFGTSFTQAAQDTMGPFNTPSTFGSGTSLADSAVRGIIQIPDALRTSVADLSTQLKMFRGDNTPAAIVEVALALDEVARTGQVTTQAVKTYLDMLTRFRGDNTPAAIVSVIHELRDLFFSAGTDAGAAFGTSFNRSLNSTMQMPTAPTVSDTMRPTTTQPSTDTGRRILAASGPSGAFASSGGSTAYAGAAGVSAGQSAAQAIQRVEAAASEDRKRYSETITKASEQIAATMRELAQGRVIGDLHADITVDGQPLASLITNIINQKLAGSIENLRPYGETGL